MGGAYRYQIKLDNFASIRGENMVKRILLVADEGYILTDGEIYGTEIYLGEGVGADNFREIPFKEYEDILAAQEETDLIDSGRTYTETEQENITPEPPEL